jgi:4-hydroxy-tetrahydrodipicolinate synthase
MFGGVIPILATPFHEDERLDLESWHRLIDFVVSLGVQGVTILGVLGEANRLADHERDALVAGAVEAVSRRTPVIVGTSHSGTESARYLARRAEQLGADAVMVTPGKEPVPSDDRIVESYQRIAEGLTIPIVLQDHPASSDVHMSAALMLRLLREVPAIHAIKEEAVPTAPKIRQLRGGMSHRQVPVLCGLGALYAPFDLEAGADGFNTGFAFPEVLMAMVAAARAGNWVAVHALYARFAALIVFEQQPGVAVRKEILRRRGVMVSGRVRHPGTSLSPVMSRQLDVLLQRTLGGADITRPLTIAEDGAAWFVPPLAERV